MDKQVSGVIDAGRVIAWREFELADVVHAGFDCVVQLYLAHSEARLRDKVLKIGELPLCLSLTGPRSAWKKQSQL